MNTMNWKSVVLKDTNGNLHTCNPRSADGAEVSFRYLPIPGGYACYVSATCEVGMDGAESIMMVPDIPDTGDYLAITNHSAFWCRPAWGESLRDLHKRTQELLIRDGSTYRCYLPICAEVFKTLIRGTEAGMEFFVYSNCSGIKVCEDQLAFICMEGEDPMALLHDCAKAAAELLGNGLKMREEKQMAPIFEYLGWCSWDALHIHVNHKGLAEKAREFRDKGVPIKFGIIDDMWADVPALEGIPLDIDMHNMIKTMHKSKLLNFAGSPLRFPDGIEAAVRDMKADGIEHIGIWFPTTGYWSGLDPEGGEAKRQAENTVVSKETEQIVVAPEVEKTKRFFNDFCERVKDWGCDFVKIDNQGFHNRYQNMVPIGESARAIQKGIDYAADRNFDGALINCMGMPSECMFNRTGCVSRCSDDFSPENREWFAKNVLQCSYNGLLQGQYYVNDWDMWWTDDAQAKKNSICRAISGGPIYVSDKIGRTRAEILRPVALRDGRILRCDESATPTVDCLMQNPTLSGKIFKIRNVVGKNGVVAVFDIDAENRSVSGTLAATEAGLPAGDYVWYEYFSGDCGILKNGEKLDITLAHNDDFRLYSFVPYRGGVTAVGRTDLFIGVKATVAHEGNRVTVVEGGDIGLVSEQPIKVFANGQELATTRRGMLTQVKTDADVTEIEYRV